MTRELPHVVICDLDGTLGDIQHRAIHAVNKDWPRFNGLLGEDPVIHATAELLRAYMARGYIVVLCTGRSEEYRDATIEWLNRNEIQWHRLLMRPRGNFESDTLIKPGLVVEAGYTVDRVLMILEDRWKMVETWRSMGYTCWQVAPSTY